MDAIIGVVVTIGTIIAIKWWWSYLGVWWRSIEGWKMMMEMGGPELVKKININALVRNAMDKAKKKQLKEEDDDDEVMYQ